MWYPGCRVVPWIPQRSTVTELSKSYHGGLAPWQVLGCSTLPLCWWLQVSLTSLTWMSVSSQNHARIDPGFEFAMPWQFSFSKLMQTGIWKTFAQSNPQMFWVSTSKASRSRKMSVPMCWSKTGNKSKEILLGVQDTRVKFRRAFPCISLISLVSLACVWRAYFTIVRCFFYSTFHHICIGNDKHYPGCGCVLVLSPPKWLNTKNIFSRNHWTQWSFVRFETQVKASFHGFAAVFLGATLAPKTLTTSIAMAEGKTQLAQFWMWGSHDLYVFDRTHCRFMYVPHSGKQWKVL